MHLRCIWKTIVAIGLTLIPTSSYATELGFPLPPTGNSTINELLRGHVFNATANFNGTNMFVFVNSISIPGSRIRVAVYSVSGGVPQNLLVESTPKVMLTGWNQISLQSTVSIVAGNDYFLCMQVEKLN